MAGTALTPVDFPSLGATIRSKGTCSPGCDCGGDCGCNGGGDCGCGCEEKPSCPACVEQPPEQGLVMTDRAIDWNGPPEHPEYVASGGMDPLQSAASAINRLKHFAYGPMTEMQRYPSVTGGSLLVDPGNQVGSLIMQVRHPCGGPFDPQPIITLQASNGLPTVYLNYQRNIGGSGANVSVNTGTGGSFSYSNPDVSGYYDVGNAQNSLQQVGLKWTERRADGWQYNYDNSGFLKTIRNPSGARWTITNDISGNPQKIVNPFGKRTSFTFDGSGNLTRALDACGRMTTLVYGTSGLTRIEAADGAVTSFTYSLNPTRLKTIVNALGERTTLGFVH